MGRPAKPNGALHPNGNGWRWFLNRSGVRLRSKTWATKEEASAELAKVVENPAFVPSAVTKRAPGSGHIAKVPGGYRWETHLDKVRRYGRAYPEKRDAEEELAKVLAEEGFTPKPCRWVGRRRPSEAASLKAAAEAKAKREAREALIKSGMQLVRQTAAKQFQKYGFLANLEDLLSAGFEGLIKAADTFDPSVGAPFLSYAIFRIKGHILDYLRTLDHVTRHTRVKAKNDNSVVLPEAPVSLEYLIEEAGDSWMPIQDFGEFGDTAESSEHVRRACLKLSERFQTALAMYYFEDKTLAAVGEALGVTESRVCQILREARLQLKQILEIEMKVA